MAKNRVSKSVQKRKPKTVTIPLQELELLMIELGDAIQRLVRARQSVRVLAGLPRSE